MSDRFALSNAIGDAGIERAKAERSASVIFDAIRDNVATKADVQALGAELKVEIERGRTETTPFALETTLRSDMTQMENRLLRRLGGLMVVLVGCCLPRSALAGTVESMTWNQAWAFFLWPGIVSLILGVGGVLWARHIAREP